MCLIRPSFLRPGSHFFPDCGYQNPQSLSHRHHALDPGDNMKGQPKSAVVVLPKAALQLEDGPQPPVEQSLTLKPIEFPEKANASSLVPMYTLRKEGNPQMLVEILRFEAQFGSWFFVPEDVDVAPDVCSNGNITIVTAVDPLFCALVLMDALGTVGEKLVFQPLDDLCVTADGTNLMQLCDASQFDMLCDVKEAGGEKFYRLSEEKVIGWLRAKHSALTRQPNLKSASAVDIMCQYLTPAWGKRLRKDVLGNGGNAESSVENESTGSANLALQVMMEDARRTNQSTQDERDRKMGVANSRVKKPAKKAKVAKKKEKAPEAKFWASREKSLGKKRNAKQSKARPTK